MTTTTCPKCGTMLDMHTPGAAHDWRACLAVVCAQRDEAREELALECELAELTRSCDAPCFDAFDYEARYEAQKRFTKRGPEIRAALERLRGHGR